MASYKKEMKKYTIGIILTIIFLTAALIASVASCFCWLSFLSADVPTNIQGEIVTSYFYCGDGSENDPYVITTPKHLDNLSELYQLKPGFAEENNYFRLGYDFDNDGDLEFQTYDDNGRLVPNVYSDVLNMSTYEDFIPIGTEEKPFGGTFDGSGLTVENLEIATEGLSDIGFFGYVTEDATVKDLYLDNITIDISDAVVDAHDVHAENAFVGYIAGHIENANCFTNTYVNNSEIKGSSCFIRNDWGYYGHCDNASSLDAFIAHAGAEDPSWGGSVNMQKMYNRLYDIAGDATRNNNYIYEKDVVERVNGTTFERDRTTARAYTQKDREEGSFVFSAYADNDDATGNYLYISGGTRNYPYKQTETTHTGGFTIYNNNRYLGINNNGAIANTVTVWHIENNKLTAYVNGTTYYLTHNVTLSTNTSDTWTKGTNTIYYSGSGWFSRTYYLYCNNNGTWTTQTSSHTLTLATASYTSITETSNGDPYMDYTGTNVTYFPLITEEDNYNAGSKNTGYVMGGSQDKTTSGDYPYKTGDIRVSKYTTSNISASYSGGNLTTVYTINSNLQTTQINQSDYEKYSASKDGFLNSITGGNIYGLHFMSASINKDHLVTADYTLINGEEKTNYQMPASSIDFNLTEKGYINFFAGTYFSKNNSFFSLHHIERDENNAITGIQEIAEIYKSSNDRKDYIYKYTDGSYSDTLTSDYSLTFSTARIKKQNSVTQNAVYYFEIPVNSGEYALGSVDGGTGCYLMYLDIGSNGGIDFDAKVDTFGSVDYRSSPDKVETSLLLITYEQQANQTINLKVVYIEAQKRYNITYSGTLTEIIVTPLSTEYVVYFNEMQLPQQIQKNYLH